jgi:hypothetical protein
MMNRHLALGMWLLSAVLVAQVASAKSGSLSVVPFILDPNDSLLLSSLWIPGLGIPGEINDPTK